MDPTIEPETPLYEGTTTPPTLSGYPPALKKMASAGNIPQKKDSKSFDIVETYHKHLKDDPDIYYAFTVYETLDLVKTQSDYLKSQIPNSISLSAGTDLFQRYMIQSLKPSSTGNFETVRQHLLSNGRLFVSRAKVARHNIAMLGRDFVRDGSVVLTHGGSRVVGALLDKAAEARASGGNVRFKVIYVMNDARSTESKAVVTSLRAKGVPVATISEGAIGYAMGKVDLVIVGAEGCGGKRRRKPFYVAAESHKFVRLYPLGQYDLGIDQEVIDFRTEDDEEEQSGDMTPKIEEREEYSEAKKIEKSRSDAVDAVDLRLQH
ncbi:hypothetical protein DID88_005251 [Monilinia fructigena]|uniref:Translation initiation factor eIF2B subunit alpha n=1 Tax=Monilinia fructigena TaxID=38457 RepID=A0A395J4L0_9HELO|nr:hypothetical protein DID88_005251 [Monilinia fructigena]